MTKQKGFKRPDGRKVDEMRKMGAKVGIVPNADGSAMFSFGDTIAIAAVYGPKKMHPKHQQDPEKGTLRCTYNMLSFSVTERIKPGPSRRSTEISKITEWALEPVVMISQYPNNVVDLTKKEEDWEEGEGSTDIPITLTHDNKITHIQLDGKIEPKQLKEAIELA